MNEDLHMNLNPAVPEVEELVLAAVMVEKTAMPLVMKYLRMEMFYEEKHREIFSAVEELYLGNVGIDILTVTEQLKRRGTLEKVGGPFAIAVLSGKLSSAAHLEYHAMIVKEYFMRRQLAQGLMKLSAQACNLTCDFSEVITDAQTLINNILEDKPWQQNLRTMPVLMEDTVGEAAVRMERSKNGVTGIPTGLTELDEKTSGWQGGELTVIAGRPSDGKTAVALHMARTAAMAGHHVVFFSLEMSGTRLGDRWMLTESGINPYAWKRGQLSPEDWQKADEARERLSELPMQVDDTPYISMDEICATSRMLRTKGECDIVFVDYLQLCKVSGQGGRTREQEVSEASRKAKALAKELNCPVVLLSQLNRAMEGRPQHIPQLCDLRESGAIEQDADVVLLLYRPAKLNIPTDKESGYPTEGLGIGILAKNRNGECGKVYFGHDPSMTHIGDYVPTEEYVRKMSGSKP